MKKERGCHALIQLQFGDGRINLNFDPTQRQWDVINNAEEGPSDTNSVVPESLISGGNNSSSINGRENLINNLADKQAQFGKQLMVLKDLK